MTGYIISRASVQRLVYEYIFVSNLHLYSGYLYITVTTSLEWPLLTKCFRSLNYLWISIWISWLLNIHGYPRKNDIDMDIDMDMDGIFLIHGKPALQKLH